MLSIRWIVVVVNLGTWSIDCLAVSDGNLDELYKQVSQSRQQGLIDKADELAGRLMQASEQSGDSTQQGKANFALARNYMERNQYPQAKLYLDKAIELFQEAGNEKWLADSYRQLGLTFRYQTDYPEALRYIYLAMQIYQQLDDPPSISSAYNSIGLVKEKMGQYEEAIQAHQKALELNYQLDDKPGVASAIYNLGDIHRVMGDHQKALNYFNDALAMDLQIGEPKYIAYSHNKLGYVLTYLGEYDSAREHIQKAIDLFREIKAPRDTDWALSSMAKLHIDTGDYEQARHILEGILQRAEQEAYKSLKVDVLILLAEVSYLQQDASAALNYIEQGSLQAGQNNEFLEQSRFAELRVKVHVQQDAFKQAFNALQLQKQLDDQLLNDKRIATIASIQAQTEFVRIEHRIELLEKERALQQAQIAKQQQQRNIVFASILAAVILAFLVYRGYQRKRLNAKLSTLVKRRTEQLNNKNQELQTAYQKVEALSLTDRLTGLNNRLYLEQHVSNDLELSRRRYTDWQNGKAPEPQNADIVTFMIDLDHFKHINDQHGHNAGDLVLKEFKHRLQKVFRESDYLIRWGGEEFICVARQVNRNDAIDLATRLLKYVRQTPFQLEHKDIFVTCSIGFASYPLSPTRTNSTDNWQTIIKLADVCLYAAKNTGRDCCVGIESADDSCPDLATLNAKDVAGLVKTNQIKAVTSVTGNKIETVNWYND